MDNKNIGNIEKVKIDVLIPYARNSRTHSEEQVAQVAASIKEFGFTNPVLIDADNTIISGHGRVLAARKLGMSEVPCIRIEYMTDAQKRAYIIADNKLALNAGWDEELLSLELGDLREMGFDLSLTGFDEDELDGLLLGDEDELEDEDEVPPIEENPVSRRGDVWLLGHHRVMCGDSTDAEQITKLLDGAQADLYITDPPYNVDYKGGTKAQLKIQNDNMDSNAFLAFLTDAFTAANSVLKPGAAFYIWHASSEVVNFINATEGTIGHVREQLVWVKQSMVLGRQDYQWRHEPCLYGWKEGASHNWYSDRSQTTVLEFNKPNRNGEHPTMKPVELFAYQIKNSSKRSDVVLDSFGGSGTTLIACEQASRSARLMELDERYADVIVKRWQDFTGKQATLEATGQTFDELKAERVPMVDAGEPAPLVNE